jgi:hypothetical protein
MIVEELNYTNSHGIVGFQVLTAASMVTAAFRAAVPCGLVEVHRCYTSAWCIHHQG